MSQFDPINNSGVVFDNENQQKVRYNNEQRMPKIISLVIKYSGGLIKNEKYANVFLFIFATVTIIVSIYLISNGGDKAKIVAPSGYKVIYPQNEPPRLERL